MEDHAEPQVLAQLVNLEERIARQEALLTAASNVAKNTLADFKRLRKGLRETKRA
jgi:hypothetical protein